MAAPPVRGLRELARLCGVQPEYRDVQGNRRRTSTETLLRVLQSIVPWLDRPDQVAQVLAERRLSQAREFIAPVTVAWLEELPSVTLRFPSSQAHGALDCRLTTEAGDEQSWTCRVENLRTEAENSVDGAVYLEKQLPLTGPLPVGYHQLRVSLRTMQAESMRIVAPRKVYAPERTGPPGWGLFVPLYALHGPHSWGAGDFSDLERLTRWTADQGGSLVATLPLLPAFFNGPHDHSPYAPVSRLFWNEFYIDVRRIPELATTSSANEVLRAADTVAEIESLRNAPTVEYNRQMALKRRVLMALSDSLFATDSPRRQTLLRYLAERPGLDLYARFRSVDEHAGRRWPEWPAEWKDTLENATYDRRVWQYYVYSQWIAEEQLGELAAQSRARDATWYLDLPLGTHAEGFDVWRYRESFATTMRGGAPPDSVFVHGQNWGFPPLHPEGLRQQRYGYFIDAVRHHLRYASLLRIDHVMCLHRLYWIPNGCAARDGAYVRYRADELYAILSVESHRQQAAIVGENLGTVPTYVNAALKRHGVSPMYVLQYELDGSGDAPLNPVPPRAVASLNTHDLPTFASYFQELDLADRVNLDLLSPAEADEERIKRRARRARLAEFLQHSGWIDEVDPTVDALLEGCLRFLSASPAAMVLINLEDLWLETRQQNVPGTVDERPNWRRRAKYDLDELSQDPRLLEILRAVDELRRAVRTSRRKPPAK